MKIMQFVVLLAFIGAGACSRSGDGTGSVAPLQLAGSADASETVPATPTVGQVQIVAELDITPGNVTTPSDGRVFASIHGMRRGPVQLIEVTGRTMYEPFPNDSWNAPPGSGRDVLNTPHGVVIDSKDRLWVIDHGNWLDKPQPPKLFAFDIRQRTLVFGHDFIAATAPPGQSSLPDNGTDVLTWPAQWRPLARDPRFKWPDNVHFWPESWLYVAINQLHRNSIFSGAADRDLPLYLIARVWTGTPGQSGL